MFRQIVFSSFMVVAGLTISHSARATEGNPIEPLTLCVVEKIGELDDGVSPADIVARAATSVCANEVDKYVAGQGSNEMVRRELRQNMMRGDMFVAAVLSIRKEKADTQTGSSAEEYGEGYRWAEGSRPTDPDDCVRGRPEPFIQGCIDWIVKSMVEQRE